MQNRQLEEEKAEYTKFNYIDELKLPVLCLAVKYDPDLVERIEKEPFSCFINKIHKYNFTDERGWLDIVHDTAGNAINKHYMTGTILKPKTETGEGIKQINNSWLDTNCGVWGVTLEEILEYKKQLNELLEVDCNISYIDFEEGIYPIDCSVENIRKLAFDEVPDKLDELIKWKSDLEKFAGVVDRWNLYILGQNSD